MMDPMTRLRPLPALLVLILAAPASFCKDKAEGDDSKYISQSKMVGGPYRFDQYGRPIDPDEEAEREKSAKMKEKKAKKTASGKKKASVKPGKRRPWQKKAAPRPAPKPEPAEGEEAVKAEKPVEAGKPEEAPPPAAPPRQGKARLATDEPGDEEAPSAGDGDE
jgi:hypothetical protein